MTIGSCPSPACPFRSELRRLVGPRDIDGRRAPPVDLRAGSSAIAERHQGKACLIALSPNASLNSKGLPMRKQVLVSVDRGRPAWRCWRRREAGAKAAIRRRKDPTAGYRVAELYLERRGAGRSSATSTRAGRQRPARARGRVRRHRPRQERLPARRRDRAAGVETPRAAAAAGAAAITDLLKPGQEVVVQVVKDPLKTKGARSRWS
jgi:Ribonuclease G/E